MQERADQPVNWGVVASDHAAEIALAAVPMPECANVFYATNHWAAATTAPEPVMVTNTVEINPWRMGPWPHNVEIAAWTSAIDRLGYGRRPPPPIDLEAAADAYAQLASPRIPPLQLSQATRDRINAGIARHRAAQ